LEGNNLTADKTNNAGIRALGKALVENKTLLCLNLTNTNLDDECGKILL